MRNICKISHTYKCTNSTSAERTRICNNAIVNHFHIPSFATVGNRKTKNKINKKTKRFNQLENVGEFYTNVNDHEVVDNINKGDMVFDAARQKFIKKKTFYYNFYNDTNRIEGDLDSELKQLFENASINMVKIRESGFQIIDTYQGCRMTHDNYPVFFLVPRSDAIKVNKNKKADHDCLMWLSNNHSNLYIRGKEVSGFGNSYVTVGAHSNRNAKGIHIKKINDDGKKYHEPYLRKWFQRAKLFAIKYLPVGLMSGLQLAKFLVDDEINYEFNKNHTNKKIINDSVYASMATSSNYIAPAHVDKDSFLSCLFVTLKTENNTNDSKKDFEYENIMDVCVYFSFPDYNKTVALRPGDVLFFNPLKKHCVSQRTMEYISDNVFCSTFYINTKTISGNDATKPIKNHYI
jgi:hypothetical protein